MAKVIMTCGKICCGKTTYAEKLRNECKAVILSIDEFMLSLFGQDAGDKHDEYVRKIEGILLKKSVDIVGSGTDVILDWGFWTKEKRRSVREFYRSHGIDYEFHYINISGSVWEERINMRNRSVSDGKSIDYFVDEGLFKKSEELFEPPDDDETDVKTIAEF